MLGFEEWRKLFIENHWYLRSSEEDLLRFHALYVEKAEQNARETKWLGNVAPSEGGPSYWLAFQHLCRELDRLEARVKELESGRSSQ